MANTRFFYDDCRTQKALDESIYTGQYRLNQPGCGTTPLLYSDPHIRQQLWGANLSQNKTELESDLRGITRKLNRDIPQQNNHLEYSKNNMLYNKQFYPIYHDEFTGQSRATHPAWVYREVDSITKPNNFQYLHIDPQEHPNLNLPFPNNIQSRIVEKDIYYQNNH